MLIKNATLAQTSLHLQTAYDQLVMDLTPEQQAQVNFAQAQAHVHEVVGGNRNLELGIEPMTRERTVQEISQIISSTAHSITDQVNHPRSGLDCGVAIATVVVDAVMVVIQAIGLPGAIAQRSSGRLVTEATALINRSLRTYQILVRNVRIAETALEKAKAYYQIFVTFVRSFGLKAIFKEIRQSMHWYDWLLMGLIILGQLLLLIATDGAAIILEISLLVLSITALGVAIFNAVQACRLDTDRSRNAPEIAEKGIVLLPGEFLLPNEQLSSANGEYRLVMLNNTNMALYNQADEVVWRTDISAGLDGVLRMGEDGTLSIRTATDSPFIAWYANMENVKGNYLLLSNTGKLVVMNSEDQTMKWSS